MGGGGEWKTHKHLSYHSGINFISGQLNVHIKFFCTDLELINKNVLIVPEK